MNVVILITPLSAVAFALILDGAGAFNKSPCRKIDYNNAYNEFFRKHILNDTINTTSNTDWEMYIRKKKLCDRPFQTFIPRQDQNLAVKICNGGGIRHYLNLCISKSSILVYDVNVSTYNCKVTNVVSRTVYPVVACNKVSNRCRPTHYQASFPAPPLNGWTCSPSALKSFAKLSKVMAFCSINDPRYLEKLLHFGNITHSHHTLLSSNSISSNEHG